MELVAVDGAFLKGGLAIDRSSTKTRRVEAHIFIAFLAY
jgi:hypothetical protein